ncbi:MAG TPA: hypothetical protein VFT51_12950 [Bacillales bacterium]|nr:hypothetical protein [Bacillales bacterium]
MIKLLLRNPKFMTGFLFVFGLFAASVLYAILFNDHIPVIPLQYTDSGKPVKPVFSPFEHPPFGTNTLGRDLFFVILVGAKYTLGIAFIVTAGRFLISTMIGILGETYLSGGFQRFSRIGDAFRYLPATLISYFILKDLFEHLGFSEKVFVELIVLILVALPVGTQLIADETRLLYKKAFIEGAKTIGGSKWHILNKHIRPFLIPQLFIIFARELTQVLLLLAHLGILTIFIGGVEWKMSWFGQGIPVTLSGEWAGLIGKSFNSIILTSFQWIGLVPIFCFTVTILAVRLSIEGMKEVFQTEPHNLPHKPNQKPVDKKKSPGEEKFTFVRDHSNAYYDS